MNRIKAVIFDLDGVLVEAKDWHYEALNIALSLFGCDFTYEEHLEKYDGLPTWEKLRMLNSEKGFPLELSDIVHKLKQIYTQEFFAMRCFPSHSQEYLFRKLRKCDIKISVATNSIRQTLDTAINNLQIGEFIEFSLSNEDIENSKPDPEIYLKLFKMLKLEPTECLIVEDNINGIRAALASGAHLLKVKGVEEVNHANIFKKIREIEA